jgi:serine/threonine protein kinase
VVKRLKPAHTHQLVRDFFDKEAAVLEKLGKHPQIPDLLAHFMIDKDLFIVQEFVDGHSLRDEIVPGRRLGEGYVTKLLQDVLEVLVFVHESGVIHRDIKPENVMRRQQDGKLVLIDFGVVKELGSVVVNSGGSVQASVVAGTPGYMASEQARGKPGFCSDIYAVGMMAIEALTGIYPGNLPDDPQTGEVQWRDQVQVSSQLATIIEKMVREFYRQRYPSAIEALQALQPIISPPPPPAPAPISHSRSADRLSSPYCRYHSSTHPPTPSQVSANGWTSWNRSRYYRTGGRVPRIYLRQCVSIRFKPN